MIRTFDDNQLLGLGKRVDQTLQLRARSELISCSANEELGLMAVLQKFKCVNTWLFGIRGDRSDWRSNSNHGLHTRVSTGGAKADCRSERKTSEDNRQMKLCIEPVERRANVLDLSYAVTVLPLAQSRSTKVEAQNWKSKTVESFHRVKDNFVVQRASKKGVRMTDHSGMCRILGSCIEQRLQASSRTVEKK